jgi:hypothetical protein
VPQLSKNAKFSFLKNKFQNLGMGKSLKQNVMLNFCCMEWQSLRIATTVFEELKQKNAFIEIGHTEFIALQVTTYVFLHF